MKRIGFLLSSVVVLFSMCKNDVKILAPYKDIPVIYGLLDQHDTIHYIKVNKAFEGIGNSYTMAKQYDSINYPVGTITVQLQNTSTNATVTLDTTTSIKLDSGIFSYPYQVIYWTKEVLDPNAQYKLIVTNTKTGKVCSGTTGLLPDVSFSSPNSFMTSTPISFTTISPPYPATQAIYKTNSQALIYQLAFRFYYNEIDTGTGDTAHDYADWVFAPHTITSDQGGIQLEDDYSGTAFMQFLVGTLKPAAPKRIKRVPVNVEVMFTSGSTDLYTYIELSQPSLNANQQKPFFSDVSNGIGLFTSRHTQTVVKPLSGATVNLLDTDSYVRTLNFRSH